MLQAMLVGNIGSDPELKYAPSGSAILQFSVACNGRIKDQSGDWVEETTWVRVTVFGNRAEALGQFLKKGAKVYVDGRLTARPWTDRRGDLRSGLEVAANNVEVMSPRDADSGERGPGLTVVRGPAAGGNEGELPF